MQNKKEKSWLFEQLPVWVEEDLIDSEQAERIKEFYGEPAAAPSYNLALIIAGTIGALLIGGGIILIFAYNWEELSKLWRTILSFLPLILAQLIYGYAFFRKKESIPWVEASSVFLMLMIASSMALIDQTYHLGGGYNEFIFTWMILSIPLMYLMNASLVTVFYLIGIAHWGIYTTGSNSVIYWGLLLVAIPHFYFNVRKEKAVVRRNILGWTLVGSLAFGWFGVIEEEIPEFVLLGSALLLSLFYMIGQQVYKGRNFVRRPFQTFSVAGIVILLLTVTFAVENLSGWDLQDSRFSSFASYINIIMLCLIGLGYVYFLGKNFKNRTLDQHLLTFFPLVIWLFIILLRADLDLLKLWLSNLFALAFSIIFIYEGVRQKRMGKVNLGMLILVALIVYRFISSDWSFIVKGVMFILLGLCFLGVNVILSRRLKREE